MEHAAQGHEPKHYRRLLVMTVISFIAMYVLMYAMVDRLANVYPNFNQERATSGAPLRPSRRRSTLTPPAAPGRAGTIFLSV